MLLLTIFCLLNRYRIPPKHLLPTALEKSLVRPRKLPAEPALKVETRVTHGAQVETQNMLSTICRRLLPPPQPQSPLVQKYLQCHVQSPTDGTYAFIQMQFLLEGEQSKI